MSGNDPCPAGAAVLSAWALVMILGAGGFAAVELAPSSASRRFPPGASRRQIPQATRIPQRDPFNLGPPLVDNAEHDFDVPGELME